MNTKFDCPYAKIVTLDCNTKHRDTELNRQIKHSKTLGIISRATPHVTCHCDPELCSRYVRHLVNNIQKYKYPYVMR